MMRHAWKALAALAVALTACDKVDDIDRTQANRVDKAIFNDGGEWYYAQTVVEAQFNQGLVVEGAMGDGDKIRWDIQERQLVGYRSYPYLVGQEQNNNGGGRAFYGSPVVAFAITSHFDVRREYNPATGDQNNVIVENVTDRPWFERQYMRVDWSLNLVKDGWASVDATVMAYPSTPYYTQEHELDNPWRAEVTRDAINVVGNYAMETDPRVCSVLQDFNCGKADIKVKLSFLRAGNRDYDPLYYPDTAIVYDERGAPVTDCDGNNDGLVDGDCTRIGVDMFARFGYFRSQRLAYSNEYQWTRDGRVYLANRFNIWQANHDATGALIPIANRAPRTVTYYTNVDFPEDLFDTASGFFGMWDGAFRKTVATLKNTQGRNLNITPEQIPQMLALARNSCSVDAVNAYAAEHKHSGDLARFGIGTVTRENLRRACTVLETVSGGAFTWQKPGDIRYSGLNWQPTPVVGGGILGYGPHVSDPVTGETIAAYANVYGAVINNYSASAADYIAAQNGDVSIEAISSGEFARARAKAAHSFSTQAHAPEKMATLDGRNSKLESALRASKGAGSRQGLKNTLSSLTGKGAAEVKAYAGARANSRLNKLAQSHIDREILSNTEITQGLLAGDADASPIGALRDLASEDTTIRMRLAKGGCALDTAFADEGLQHIAEDMEGLSYEEIYTRSRQLIFAATAAHEVGHTLGLRHNFEGSFDALNYPQGFWKNFDPATNTVKRVDGSGKSTKADRYMYSSIMDYSARAFDDIGGIGPYDEAAIAFGYGGLVEVWNNGIAPFGLADLLYLYDYTDIPKILAGGLSCTNNANCQDDLQGAIEHYNAYIRATDIATRQTEYELYNRGVLTYLKNALDGQTAKPDNIRARRYITFDALYNATREYYANNSTELLTYDEVPYRFCPDDLVFDSNVTCQPFDKGANYRELVNDRWTRYSQYYAFTAFKRDRATFATRRTNLRTYAARLSRNFFGPIASVYRYYLYGNDGLGYDTSGQWLTLNDFPVGRDWQTASIDGLNDLVSVIEMPEPGAYCLNGDIYQPMSANATCATEQISVPAGIGRYINTTWSTEYDYEPTRIGAFWDKYAAYTAITSNEGYFYRNFNDYLDSGAFSLSYWRGLHTELVKLFTQSFDPSNTDLAWIYDPTAATEDAKFRAMPLFDGYTAGVPTGHKIAPSTSWTLRYYSVVLPMARYDSMYDYTEDFLNYSRVCLEGYADCVTFGTEDVLRYEDPLTHFTYIAPRTVGSSSDPELDEANLGALAVADAAAFAADYPTLRQAYVDAVAGSDPTLIASTWAALQQKEAGINERSGFLDIVRQLSQTFGK